MASPEQMVKKMVPRILAVTTRFPSFNHEE